MSIDHGQNDLHRLRGIAGGLSDAGQAFIGVNLDDHVRQHQIAVGIRSQGRSMKAPVG